MRFIHGKTINKNRKKIIFLAILYAGLFTFGNSLNVQAKSDKFVEKFNIPEDNHLLIEGDGNLGRINHGCDGGLYTLEDGKFTSTIETTYSPSEEAWLAGDAESRMILDVTAKYAGDWGVDTDPKSLFKLKGDKEIKAQVEIFSDDTSESQIRWEGSYANSETGLVSDWWNFDVFVSREGQASGIADGTCGDLSVWEDDGDEEESPLRVDADFNFYQSEANTVSQIPWDHQRIQVDANNVDEISSLRWSDPENPEESFAETNIHCIDFGRSFEGEDDYVNLVGDIHFAVHDGEVVHSLMGTWFFVQLERGVDEPELPGEQSMHNAGFIDPVQAEEMCHEVTPEEIPEGWQTVIVPPENGYIQFFDLGDGGGDEGTLGSIFADFVTTNLFDTSETDGNFQLFYLHNVTPEVDNPEVLMAFDYQSSVFENGGQNPGPISHIEPSCVNIADDGSSAFIAGYVKEDSDAFVGKWLVVQLVDGDTDGIYWSTPTWDQAETEVMQTCEDVNGTVDPETSGWNYSPALTHDGSPTDAIDIQPPLTE